MPIASEWLLSISSLPSGATASEHLLAVTGGGSVIQIYDELEVVLMADYGIELEEGNGVTLDDDHSVEIEADIIVEVL